MSNRFEIIGCADEICARIAVKMIAAISASYKSSQGSDKGI